MARLFVSSPLTPNTELELTGDPARHARALRLQVGAVVELFDGTGGCYPTTVVAVERRRLLVRTGDHVAAERESPLAVTLVQGVSKGERMDWTVQKAVEFGVARIVPVFTARSVVQLRGERLQRKAEHWRGVVRSACEQCGRNTLPQLEDPLPLAELWEQLPGGMPLLLHPDEAVRLGELGERPAAGVTLVVGPEGGFNADEVARAGRAGCTPLALGPRVLRTESAGIGALAALQTRWGDLG